MLLFVFQGLGRGVWESTNKAIFLEYFKYDVAGAGSNLIIQNGGASALAFFVNAYASASPTVADCKADGQCPAFAAEGWIVVVSSGLAIVGFIFASKLFNRGVNTWSDCSDGSNDSDEALLAP